MVSFNLNRLKAERIAKGLTVKEMAEQLGMSSSTYSKKENGKIRVNVEDLSAVLTVLEIPEEDCGIFFTNKVDKLAT